MRLLIGKYGVLVEDCAEVLYKDGRIALYHADAIKEIHLDADKVEKVGIYESTGKNTKEWAPIPKSLW